MKEEGKKKGKGVLQWQQRIPRSCKKIRRKDSSILVKLHLQGCKSKKKGQESIANYQGAAQKSKTGGSDKSKKAALCGHC